jgi:hypothetical protein
MSEYLPLKHRGEFIDFTYTVIVSIYLIYYLSDDPTDDDFKETPGGVSTSKTSKGIRSTTPLYCAAAQKTSAALSENIVPLP